MLIRLRPKEQQLYLKIGYNRCFLAWLAVCLYGFGQKNNNSTSKLVIIAVLWYGLSYVYTASAKRTTFYLKII